jgi:hypothetical protein
LLNDVPWHPIIDRIGPGIVALSVEWPSDKTPACGSCTYDFSFELGPYSWENTTELRFQLRSCPGCEPDDTRQAKLRTGDGEQTIVPCIVADMDAGRGAD